LFNAMSPMHHRDPGMVGAALAHAAYAEIIPDLLHVHPGAIRAALRAIPRLYVVTDSTSAAGMPDGEYHLGSQRVTKCLGGMRLAGGTLAGSTLTMDQALRNLVSIGLPIADVSARLSRHAADVRARHTGADRDDPAARGRARPFCRDRPRLANLDVAWVAVARSTSYAAMRPSATRCTARNGAPRGLSPAAAYRQPAR
jgi:N-acetylglucosamine-6-phosphate deacetylase